MRIFCLVLLMLLWHPLVQGQSATDAVGENSIQAERTRIEVQRKQETARYALEERQCSSKFAVNDCLKSVRARQREVLADLRRQEISLNDAQRRRLGARQLELTESKLSESGEPVSAAKATSKDRSSGKTQDPAQPAATEHASAPQQAQRKKNLAEQEAARAAQAKAHQRQFQQKKIDAEKHKADVQARQIKQTKPNAKPLPDPP
jgi:membrane protein involved in colicin uptake